MPAFEIHVETFIPEVEGFPVIEAKDAYEAAITFAMKFAPCRVRRVRPEVEGDVFAIFADGSRAEDGVEIEVYEHDEEWGRV